MPRILSVFICLSILSACATSTPDAARELTVLSYNIHHGQGTDGRFDLERLAQVRELRKHLETGGLPTLLVGDLNATPGTAPMASDHCPYRARWVFP